MFVLGSMADDIKCCKRAVKKGTPDSGNHERVPIPGQLNFEMMQLVPLSYQWALTQAIQKRSGAHTNALARKAAFELDHGLDEDFAANIRAFKISRSHRKSVV